MSENITQEDLNAVRQQLRAYNALGKMEPLLQKVLVAEEQAQLFEKEKQAAISERDRVRAEIKAERERHLMELEAEHNKQQAQFETAAETARKRLADELSAKEKEIEERRRTSQQLGQHIEALRRQESEIEGVVTKLGETRDSHKKEIASLLAKLNTAADRLSG